MSNPSSSSHPNSFVLSGLDASSSSNRRGAPWSGTEGERISGKEGGAVREAESGGLPEGGKGLTEVESPLLNPGLAVEERPSEALRAALEVFALTGYWVTFYKAVLGPKGVVASLFTTPDELDYFTGTREFDEIQQMLTALRTSDQEKTKVVEAVSMITIRIPRSLQTSLAEEAKRHGTSMNKLCISKLLTPANPKYVPTERGRVRGRKPQRQNH